MLGKREAWALHLLFCALPKRAEVKCQGDWRIPCCMPTDRVSRVGEGRGSPWRDRCLCVCEPVYIYLCEHACADAFVHTHVQVFMCELVLGASFFKTFRRSFRTRSIWSFLLMFTALWESFGRDSPIIWQHLPERIATSAAVSFIYSKNVSDPFWVHHSKASTCDMV